MQNQLIRASVRTMYDMQKLRIQSGNRIVAAFRVKLGIQPGESEESEGNEEADKLLKELRLEYKRITDGVKRLTKNIKIDSPLITTLGELALLEAYERQLSVESMHEKAIQDALNNEPIWTHYLANVRGVGPLMAGVILSEIDIHKSKYASSIWKYAGLDVAPNAEGVMEGRNRKAGHLVPKTYTNRAGETIETTGITFNPFLKTKLVGVLADIFIKLGGPYRVIYDNYKHRLENHEIWKERSKGHRHNAAKRYMIKMFLADLYKEWRTLEGLPVYDPYQEAKLGHKHAA
jgi:hypothetical protein